MKFAKLMGRAEELLPDLRHLCLRYKALKKQLKLITADEQPDGAASTSKAIAQKDSANAEQQFCDMLHEDIKRLNDYFCDKEEEVVIWLQQLDEQLSAAETLRDRQLCHIGYIHLHGQLVLLFHWSMLNYAALVKILKKHDKMSGVVELKAPILSNALKQPFSTTGMLSSLMAKCESKAHELNDLTGGLETLLDACPQYKGLFLIKETQAALDLWNQLRKGASTPSTLVDPSLMDSCAQELSNARKRRREDADKAAGQASQAKVAGTDSSGVAVQMLASRREASQATVT